MIKLTEKGADVVHDALENPSKPNQAAIEIAKKYKDSINLYQDESGRYFGGGLTENMPEEWVDALVNVDTSHLPKS